ncbi:hypothetical protein ACTPEF_26705, partial [Clostridioides difficile]
MSLYKLTDKELEVCEYIIDSLSLFYLNVLTYPCLLYTLPNLSPHFSRLQLMGYSLLLFLSLL